MPDFDAANFLNDIRAKTKVRGDDIESRYNFVIDRWRKVIEDCRKSDDNSSYRIEFAEIHEDILLQLEKEVGESLNIEDVVDTIVSNFTDYYLEIAPFLLERAGQTDALAYIISELEGITNVI